MLPHLEIHRHGPSFYSYSVRAFHRGSGHCEDGLDSLERCLNDAAESLGHYFSSVSVSLDGQELGSYEVHRLAQHPLSMAAELMVKAHPPVLKQFA